MFRATACPRRLATKVLISRSYTPTWIISQQGVYSLHTIIFHPQIGSPTDILFYKVTSHSLPESLVANVKVLNPSSTE